MTGRRYIGLKISQKTSQSIKIKFKKIQGCSSYRKKNEKRGSYLSRVNRIIIVIIIAFEIVFKNSKSVISKCTFQSPKNDAFQSPENNIFQSPKNGTFQSPVNSTFQSPEYYTFQSPKNNTFQSHQK